MASESFLMGKPLEIRHQRKLKLKENKGVENGWKKGKRKQKEVPGLW
jgi:hypothetical protein